MESRALTVGFVLYPGFALLDVMGPIHVFGLVGEPPARPILLARTLEPVAATPRVRVQPDATFDDCPRLDVLVVPGGPRDVQPAEGDGALELIRRAAPEVRYLLSVGTGALVLASAGLLHGKLVTTHWASLGAIRERAPRATVAGGYPRYVIDGKLVCTAGHSSSIDGALALVAMLRGAEEARAVQLALQYAPVPPFASGDPSQAEPRTVARAQRLLDQHAAAR